MAESTTDEEVANVIGGVNDTPPVQLQLNFWPGGMFLPPGAIIPYSLPPQDARDPFDPIANYAISESGNYGPLDKEKLKEFLREKLNRNKIYTKDLLKKKYTENISGFYNQLKNLQNRINQIERSEKDKTKVIKNIIGIYKKALTTKINKGNGDMPEFVPYNLPSSEFIREAFKYAASKGPLSEADLFNLLEKGEYDISIPLKKLVDQLGFLDGRIDGNIEISKTNTKFTVNKIVKAINDITIEMMLY